MHIYLATTSPDPRMRPLHTVPPHESPTASASSQHLYRRVEPSLPRSWLRQESINVPVPTINPSRLTLQHPKGSNLGIDGSFNAVLRGICHSTASIRASPCTTAVLQWSASSRPEWKDGFNMLRLDQTGTMLLHDHHAADIVCAPKPDGP